MPQPFGAKEIAFLNVENYKYNFIIFNNTST